MTVTPANAEELCFLPAAELRTLIARKSLSPVEVTETVLARIARLEPSLNAFATLDAEGAMAAARAAEAAVTAGKPLGALHGVPVTVKDMMAVKGLPTERGSYVHQGQVADEDTPFVARLRAAGAIVLGKTTTCEFGWKGVSNSPLTGLTHNPWRHGLNAGASSAGAGVGAAAGYGPLHQGSDGAGSIRMPAHFCGVVGLKPTFGRVPYTPMGNNDYQSHNGPLTRTVRDTALMLQVMAGPHPLDFMSCEAPPAAYPDLLESGISGKRIAFSPDLGHARVDPEIAALVLAAARRFEALGAHVEQITPAWGPTGPGIIRQFWPINMSGHVKFLEKFAARMDPGLVAAIHAGSRFSAANVQDARERKLAYALAVSRWFEDWDLLLTPAVSVAAFPVELLQPPDWPQHPWDWLMWAEFSYPFNFAHNPAISIPCGFTGDGLPVGLQIAGKRFDDLGVLQAAAAYEAAHPWAQHRPK